MEVILAIATILGGMSAAWYFVDKAALKRRRDGNVSNSADEQRDVRRRHIRSTIPGSKIPNDSTDRIFFLAAPHQSLSAARTEAEERGVPVFAVVFDPEHRRQSKLNYCLGYFMEYDLTKRLVQDHFVTALVPCSDPDAAGLIPDEDPLEKCRWIIMQPDGSILRSEGVYANPDEGLKRVRAVVSELERHGSSNGG